LYLMAAHSKRMQGERLTNSELKKEREAYLRVNNEEN